jgi:hypothetical protein
MLKFHVFIDDDNNINNLAFVGIWALGIFFLIVGVDWKKMALQGIYHRNEKRKIRNKKTRTSGIFAGEALEIDDARLIHNINVLSIEELL